MFQNKEVNTEYLITDCAAFQNFALGNSYLNMNYYLFSEKELRKIIPYDKVKIRMFSNCPAAVISEMCEPLYLCECHCHFLCLYVSGRS